jgi:DNA-binding CsgD family transcriptional regulator
LAWASTSAAPGLARRITRPVPAHGDEGEYAGTLTGLALAGEGGADPGWSAPLHGAAAQALADVGESVAPLEARLAGLDRPRLRRDGCRGFRGRVRRGCTLDLAQVVAAVGREAQPPAALVSEPDAAVSGAAVTALTPRELDVLKLVAQGLSNPDIARRLFLSEHTVRRHLANILREHGLSCRAAAAAWAVRTGLA